MFEVYVLGGAGLLVMIGILWSGATEREVSRRERGAFRSGRYIRRL